MAEVLEQPEPDPPSALSRARPAKVLAPGNDGRSDLQRAEGGPVAVAGGPQVRHPLPDVRAVREPGAQHARSVDRRRYGSAAEGSRPAAAHTARHLAGRPHQGRHQECRLSRCQRDEGGADDVRPTLCK